jgi:hypothetical protein
MKKELTIKLVFTLDDPRALLKAAREAQGGGSGGLETLEDCLAVLALWENPRLRRGAGVSYSYSDNSYTSLPEEEPDLLEREEATGLLEHLLRDTKSREADTVVSMGTGKMLQYLEETHGMTREDVLERLEEMRQKGDE